MREVNGEVYYTAKEVKEQYGLAKSTLYYLRGEGWLNAYKFVLAKQMYWKKSELDALRQRPPEVVKRGPKDPALVAVKPSRAGTTIVVGVGAPATTL